MLSKDEVKHIAGLARIGITEQEMDKFSHDLSSILDWVEQLKTVAIEDVQPMAHVGGLQNICRDDCEADFLAKEAIIKAFPEEKNGYNKVKSVL